MPNKDLIKARKQFVGQRRKAARSNEMEAAAKMALGQPSKRGPSDAASRKAFFIKTRVEELKAAGKKVDRKKLAARYESGKVKREEFYAGGTKEKARRQAAAKPKPKVASKKYGSARAFESATSKPSSTTAKDTKGYSAAAYMALGQPSRKSGSSTSVKKSAAKKPATKKAATKSSGSARRFEK